MLNVVKGGINIGNYMDGKKRSKSAQTRMGKINEQRRGVQKIISHEGGSCLEYQFVRQVR